MDTTTETVLMEEAPKQRTLRAIIWVLFTIFCLLFFVLLKIPQSKVNLTVISHINQQIEPMGYTISADRGNIGIGWGIHYTLEGVKILKIQTQKTLSFSKLRISPSIFPLIQGRIGGGLLIEEGEGRIVGNILVEKQDIAAEISLDSLNLGRIGLLPFLTDFDGSAEAKGVIKYEKNVGSVKLELTKVVFDEAKVQGFNIPRILISQANIDLDFDPKKVSIRTFKLGKQAPNDDLNLNATGEVRLSPQIESSEVNVRVQLALSQKLLTSFSLIDAFLGAMKQPDGSYKFKLQGPLMGAIPMADTP